MNALSDRLRPGATRSAAFRLTALVMLVAAVFGTFGTGAQAHPVDKLPPIPDCFKDGSGYGICDGTQVPGGSAIVQMTAENKKSSFYLTGPAPLQTTKAVACGDAGCVYNHLNWVLGSGASAVLGCQPNQTTCDVRVAPGAGWVAVYVRQNNDTALLYAIYNTGKKDGAMIDGYVKDKQGNGVTGTAVDAYGQGKSTGQRGFSVSGDQGFYAMEVKAGSYKVVPSGGLGGKKAPTFKPPDTNVTVAAGQTGKADFQLQGGLDVQLTLSKATALADGYTVVTGEVVTTKYGKPAPSIPISLRPKPGSTDAAAATAGTFATICDKNSGARIWPTGSLSAPVGSSIKVVTDTTGRYRFSMTIGTVPGTFPLVAWALDPTTGQLITTDVPDVSDEKTVTITAPGAVKPAQFAGLIDLLSTDKSVSSVLQATTNDAASITQSLSEISGTNVKLGGLAYSLVSGAAGGTAALVYDDADPPSISSSGQVTASKDTLVISPGLWSGAKTQRIAAGTAFNVALQKGGLNDIPTVPQWSNGGRVTGWTLQKNSATIASQSFEYNGWPYPANKPGACN